MDLPINHWNMVNMTLYGRRGSQAVAYASPAMIRRADEATERTAEDIAVPRSGALGPYWSEYNDWRHLGCDLTAVAVECQP